MGNVQYLCLSPYKEKDTNVSLLADLTLREEYGVFKVDSVSFVRQR